MAMFPRERFTTRETPLIPGECAFLIIDMQNGFCKLNLDQLSSGDTRMGRQAFMARINNTVVPALQSILKACRESEKKIDVIHTYVESLTKDGRDQSLDYWLSGNLLPKGSVEARIIDGLTPADEEIVIPKTACSVFNSTNIDYVLRNLGVTQLVVAGIVTNECVGSAVRNAADRGYMVTLMEDGCAAHSEKEHSSALHNIKGFGRILKHDQVVKEIQGWTQPGTSVTKRPWEIYTSRNMPLQPKQSVLLVFDMQKFVSKLDESEQHPERKEQAKFMMDMVHNRAIPATQKILEACRKHRNKIDVLYTYVECLTSDCRDQSLDYWLSDIKVPKGSPDAEIFDAIAPVGYEIMIPKTACGIFSCTNVEYVLRNLGVTQLLVTGMISNQCFESAVRDAADRGFVLTVVGDACAALSQEEHESAMFNLKGFGRIVTHDVVVAEIESWGEL